MKTPILLRIANLFCRRVAIRAFDPAEARRYKNERDMTAARIHLRASAGML